MPPVVIAPPVFIPPPAPESRPAAPDPIKPPESPAVPDVPVMPKATTRDKLSDTSKLSVFEIFGLPKPSETQPMAPLNMEALSATGRITPLTPDLLSSQVDDAPQANAPVIVEAEVVPSVPDPLKPTSLARTLGKRALLRRNLGKVRNRFEG